jgi:hypothetical protein
MANPVLTTPSGSIGIHRSDNRFAFRFTGTDPDSAPFEFILYNSNNQPDANVIPGLTLNSTTGWLFGSIPEISQNQITYTFGVAVRSISAPVTTSAIVVFEFTVLSGAANIEINWITDANLGEIQNGFISTLSIQAESSTGSPLEYSLYNNPDPSDVVYQRLPQGLTLNLDGSIQGRVAFIDSDFTGDFEPQTYSFTAQARDFTGTVSSRKTFSITVKNSNTKPFENAYFISLVSDEVKLRLENIESEYFPFDYVYRANDPFFGVQKKLRILLANGLNPESAASYAAALDSNYYKKLIRLSEPRLARALDANNRIIYEAIYLRVIDDLENSQGESVAASLPIVTGAVELNSNYQSLTQDNEIVPPASTVMPNSIKNMRAGLLNTIGQYNRGTLPAWMTSRQLSGEVLGWIPAAVLAYIKPGFGQVVLNNLVKNKVQGSSLNFWVDRLVWDQNLSYVYNKTLEQFLGISFTTFDSDTTVFDGTGTKIQEFVETAFPFGRIAPRSYEAPEKNDKYLVFPRHGVLK